MSEKKIVTIGGGNAMPIVLSGLKHTPHSLTAVVTMADDGGSAGILREEFDMLPPGDVRRVLAALTTNENNTLVKLINYRFAEGRGLTGHAFGNILIAALLRQTGDFEKAIAETGKLLESKGTVLPVTLDKARLVAQLTDGSVIKGETNIDIPKNSQRAAIEKVWLEPQCTINPRADKAIREADLVIIGPGDIYTSLAPNLLVTGVAEALNQTKGKVLYITNIMTKFGETNSFTLNRFIEVIESYLPKGTLDYVAINTAKPAPARLKPYAAQNSSLVEIDEASLADKPTPLFADLLKSRGLIHHDGEKIANLIKLLL